MKVPDHSGESGQMLSLVFPSLLSAVCLLGPQETKIYSKTGVTVWNSYITVVFEYLVANTYNAPLSFSVL